MKRWRIVQQGTDWTLLLDVARFETYLERSNENQNGIAKFGPMQVRKKQWPKKKPK